jgi:chromosome segregation ATPase
MESGIRVSEVCPKAEKELEKIRRKISEGRDLGRDEATLALVSALFPYVEEKWSDVGKRAEELKDSVKGLSRSVNSLTGSFSERSERLIRDVEALHTEPAKETRRLLADLEERLKTVRKLEENLYTMAQRVQGLEAREAQVGKLLEEAASLRKLLEASRGELERRLEEYSKFLSGIMETLKESHGVISKVSERASATLLEVERRIDELKKVHTDLEVERRGLETPLS